MSQVAIEVHELWKKFRRGELHDSLRDLIPAMTKAVFRRAAGRMELGKEEFWALRDVSFQVKRGESLGIIGPNGAGKSTMLKVLTQVLRPNRGHCKVHGRVSALIEIGAGFHPDLTGRENLMLSGAILGMTRAEIRQKEESIIDFAGINDFIDTPVKRYSSGMTARLGFAIAAHMQPDVLLVDEVLSVGDARFRDKCIKHMQKLIRSDVTVVFISHILDQVQALCPNTLVLSKGQIAFSGPTDEAVRVYLSALTDSGAEDHQPAGPVQVNHIQLCDPAGREVLEWQVNKPASIELELQVAQPQEDLYVLVNFRALNGVFLGTANSDRGGMITPPVGRSRVRFTLDPNPLAPGDYLIEVQVYADDPAGRSRDPVCVWYSRQPRPASIRGDQTSGSLIRCEGQWDIVEHQPALETQPIEPTNLPLAHNRQPDTDSLPA